MHLMRPAIRLSKACHSFCQGLAELCQAFLVPTAWQKTPTFSGTTLQDNGDGRQMRTLKGHSDFVRGVAFSRDGKRVASGSGTPKPEPW